MPRKSLLPAQEFEVGPPKFCREYSKQESIQKAVVSCAIREWWHGGFGNYRVVTTGGSLITLRSYPCSRGSLLAKGTPAPFQMKANTVLTKLGECRVALIDDIAVSSQTWEDYAEHVKQGFGELLQTSLTVGP